MMTGCFRSVTPAVPRVDTEGAGVPEDETAGVVDEATVVALSSQGRNSWLSDLLCTAGAPVSALLTGATINCVISPGGSWAAAAAAPLRRKYHQPRSASRITTMPPTTPPAIAPALL